MAKSFSTSKQAALLQYQGTQNALATQQGMFNQGQANIAPYLALGQQGAGTLQNRLTELTSPIAPPPAMTQADLEATPGYQFTLSQGLKAVQNSAAARGLGLSGAALKGATDYATVAMRFSLVDATIDQRSGNVVAGDATRPQQVTEVWTFARPAGSGTGGWSLAAIQQT